MNYEKIIEDLTQQLKAFIGNRKAIIGISGGVDSAVITALCVKAVGKENVLGIEMPYGNQDTTDSKIVISHLGIKSKEINIKEIVDKFNFIELDKNSKGNVMARTRMAVLYAFANQLKGMVMGTGNKTEIEIGYFTKYGDGGVDVEPIGDLYKTEILEIAKILQLPEKIITKKPSAGLWDGQTDEDEIGATYREMDAALKGEITSGEVFEKIQKLKSNSQHKKNMPPTFQVGEEK